VPWSAVVVVSLALLAWHYLGYPIALQATVAARSTRGPPAPPEEWPPVSVIIIAHNEVNIIEERIENVLSVDYPRDKLEVIVASDASRDGTVKRARKTAEEVVVVNNPRQNKSVTRNMAVEAASHDILLFTDADTRYQPDCINRIVTHYSDPSVGAVCGSLVSESFDDGAIGKGMSVYWRWEYYLRRLQGQLGMLIKYSGANMSMRRSFYRKVPDDVDIDQMAGLDVLFQEGRSVFEPDAVAIERFPTSLEGELSTRRRLTIRALTALARHREALLPLQSPGLAVHIWSYWLLRYLVPPLLALTTVATAFAALFSRFFVAFLGIQVLCYTLAVLGYVAERRGTEIGPFSIPFSYLWANVGIFLGLLAFLYGERIYAYTDQHAAAGAQSGIENGHLESGGDG